MVLLTSSDSVLKTGSKAPSFSLKGIDDKICSLDNYKNKKAILVLFMCNHCPYVIPKMNYFVELQHKYSSLQIIAINPNDPLRYPDDNLDGMKNIAKEKGFNFPYLVDETQNVAKGYGAVCTPDPFLLNSNLEVVYHGRFDDAHGKSHLEGKTHEMEDAINQLIEDGTVTIKPSPSMGCSIKWK